MPTITEMRTDAQNEMEPDSPQTTRWSLVAHARNTDPGERMRALDALLHTYLPVLEWYLTRHTGLDPHQREDLVQGFVAAKIVEQNILTRADRSRGRFRTFLLSAFQNYVRDELRKARAARRMPAGGPPLPLEEADGVRSEDADMERQLHRAWLRQIVARAVQGMEEECAAHDRHDVWAIFRNRLLDPMLDGDAPEPYDLLVARLRLDSPSQASNLLITAKRMFNRHLRSVVSDTVADPAQVEDEIQALKKSL